MEELFSEDSNSPVEESLPSQAKDGTPDLASDEAEEADEAGGAASVYDALRRDPSANGEEFAKPREFTQVDPNASEFASESSLPFLSGRQQRGAVSFQVSQPSAEALEAEDEEEELQNEDALPRGSGFVEEPNQEAVSAVCGTCELHQLVLAALASRGLQPSFETIHIVAEEVAAPLPSWMTSLVRSKKLQIQTQSLMLSWGDRPPRRVEANLTLLNFIQDKLFAAAESGAELSLRVAAMGAGLAFREVTRRRRVDELRAAGVQPFPRVFNAFTDVQNFAFDVTKERFLPVPANKAESLKAVGTLLCDPKALSVLTQRRADVLEQRCRFSPLFTFERGAESTEDVKAVTPVDSASHLPEEHQILLGTLGIDANKDFFLEGMCSHVKLQTRVGAGFFCEGNTVLVEGFFTSVQSPFKATGVAHPPRLPSSDIFYGSLRRRLRQLEEQAKSVRSGAPLKRANSGVLGEPSLAGDLLFGGESGSADYSGLFGRPVGEEETRDLQEFDEIEADARADAEAVRVSGRGGLEAAKVASFWTAEELGLENPDSARLQLRPSLWYILGGATLADERCMSKLKSLFATCLSQVQEGAAALPAGFVFLGLCDGAPDGGDGGVEEGLENLLELLKNPAAEPIARNCHFVFVPGPKDPSFASGALSRLLDVRVKRFRREFTQEGRAEERFPSLFAEQLPRLPVSKGCTRTFEEKMHKLFKAKERVLFSTSPCRVRHVNCLMTFFRHDVFRALSFDCLLTGGADARGDIRPNFKDILINTLLGQAHLCPCKIDHRLVKMRDASLGLVPMPHLLFLCDESSPPFCHQTPGDPNDVIICNADTSFARTGKFYRYDSWEHKIEVLKVAA